MATFVILLDETEFFFRRKRVLQSIVLNIKAGSRKINRK